MPERTDRELLLQFCASLTLAEHTGDVSNDVVYVLQELKMPQSVIDAEWEDLGIELGKLGVTTLYGTQLRED